MRKLSGNSNEIVIGQGATGNGTNTITLGNSSISNTYFRCSNLPSNTYMSFIGSISGNQIVKSNYTGIQYSVTGTNASTGGSVTIFTYTFGSVYGSYLIAFNTITNDLGSTVYILTTGLTPTLTNLSTSSPMWGGIGISLSGTTITAYCGIPATYTWTFAMQIIRLG